MADRTGRPDSSHGAVRVVAAVLRRGNEFLVCQRPQHKRHGGLWEFPGGKCEPGESDAAALRRELFEELGMEVVESGRPQFEACDVGSPYVIAFIPVQAKGKPIALEHVALRWASITAIARLPLAPSDRQFVTFLQREGS